MGKATGGDSLAIIDKQNRCGQDHRIRSATASELSGGLPGIAGLRLRSFHGRSVRRLGGSRRHRWARPPCTSIDPITAETRRWSDRSRTIQGETVPGGVGSLQFDLDGVLFGGTGRGTGNLIRIDPGTGLYTLVGHSVPAALGGLALRENSPDLSFLEVAPSSVTVPPFEAIDLQVTLDARALAPGTLRARIAIETNDPDRTFVTIPVDLTVVGTPDIAIPGETVRVESAADFTGAGGPDLPRPGCLDACGRRRRSGVRRDGDFGNASEVARLFVDGLRIGTVGNVGSDCFPATGTIALAASDFAGLAADGTLEIEVANSPTVFAFCVINRHSIRLSYDTPLERLDFGTVYLGYERTLPIVIKNDGRAELRVTSIATDEPTITLGAASATVPPFGEITIPVRYAPDAVAPLSGLLRIDSDDPDEPTLRIELAGTALGAPVAEVDPPAVKAALPPWSGDATKTVRLHNTGESDLIWNADLYENLTSAQAVEEWSALPKGDESDNGAGSLSIERAGGPDAFGYRFEDSDQSGGPGFDWVDVEDSGVAVPLAMTTPTPARYVSASTFRSTARTSVSSTSLPTAG